MNKINNYNVNFTARMDIKGIQKNLQRWENVSEKFSTQTKNSNDTFVLLEDTKGMTIIAEDNGFIHLGNKVLKKLLKLNNEEIVGKFQKLLDIFNQKRRTMNDTKLQLRQLKSEMTPDKFEDAEEVILAKTLNKIHSDAKDSLENDKILKKAEIWL